MKSRRLLYLPFALLLCFAAVAIYVHLSSMNARYAAINSEYSIPFSLGDDVIYVKPALKEQGLHIGDKILSVNGEAFPGPAAAAEFKKARTGVPLGLHVLRPEKEGISSQEFDITVQPEKVVHDLNFQLRYVVGFLFTYVMPIFCILLGFWVLFLRIDDPLAWILLFLLLGLASLGLEGYSKGNVVFSFRQIFNSGWSLSMLLFGIYFPVRFDLDKRYPWLKLILVIPLAYQVIVSVLEAIASLGGPDLTGPFRVTDPAYSAIAMPINIISTTLFFVLLGWKSGTLESPDARRRLRVMLVGTTVAMAPAFSIILISVISGVRGSFFDTAPWWLALTALLLILLFPLTMAYVIVVHRAMDVSVVIRQGVQYALARNGVKVLQAIMLVLLILGVVWIARNFQGEIASQIGFVAAGVALIPLIDILAKRLSVWIDRRFFREAYDSEQILLELSENVRSMVETAPLLETVSSKISESLHVPQVALLLRHGSEFIPAFALGYDGVPQVRLNDGDTSVEKLKGKEPLVIYQDDTDSWVNEDAKGKEKDQLRELHTRVLLPLGSKNVLAGMISLGSKRSDEPFSPNDLRMLRSVADQTGLALENTRLTEAVAAEAAQKERLNTEIEIAREVQERLFPQELPVIDGLDYYGGCRPALGVGGDYYDFIELENGKFGIAIGDVSGKGIGASLMMASLQASLRGQALHYGDNVAGLMEQVNKLVYGTSTTNRYATFFYAQYDHTTKKLAYVNAGHNPPFLIRASGDVELLEEGGAVVGMLPPMLVSYTQGEITLAQGDILVGFTDGISEAMNPAEEEWGEDALLDRLKALTDRTARDILDVVVASADEFASGAKQHDDMTMIVVKVIKSVLI